MNNPIPSNLRSEAKKAAKILREFTEISARNGPDKLIPSHIIAKAEGLAILSVIKAGFMLTARGGSGIVIARLADRSWSAPSAIGIAGLGGGFEIGVEVSDLVIILNQRRAIDAFTKGGNLTFGGNCTVAVGPMGRNVEADVALRSTAAIFTYCRSKGLFVGLSLEGSYLIERKDTNRKFYLRDIRASAILNGDVEPPPDCSDLYHMLNMYTEAYAADWHNKNPSAKSLPPARPAPPSQRTAPPSSQQQPPPTSACKSPTSRTPCLFVCLLSVCVCVCVCVCVFVCGVSCVCIEPGATAGGATAAGGGAKKNTLYPSISIYRSDTSDKFAAKNSQNFGGAPAVGGAERELVVTAIHPFTGEQPGDLSFAPGDRITVTTKSDSEYDWWEGRHQDGRVGIFPANYVSH